MNTAEWECPRCGKRATANLDALGALGSVLCTCGTRSRPARCRTYWGSHGCHLPVGHTGQHACECGEPPYFGDDTNFYGEDAPRR